MYCQNINKKRIITKLFKRIITPNTKLLFVILGIWHNRYYPISSMISTANRSAAHDLFVTGDTDGYLRLFR